MSHRGRSAGGILCSATIASLGILGLASCGDSVVQLGEGDVVRLRISPDSAELGIGRTMRIRALPLDGTGALITTQRVEWTSVDPTVATVDENGFATGVGSGTAEITATVSSFEAVAELTVALPPALALAEQTLSFATVDGAIEPASASVSVTNEGDFDLVGLTVDSVVYEAGATGWLTATLEGATAPTALVVEVVPFAVADLGEYEADIWIAGFDADDSPATVHVTLDFTEPVTAGIPASIEIESGDGQEAIVGAIAPAAPTVVVRDAHGDPVSSVTVEFAASGGGSVGAGTTLTNAGGLASTIWTMSDEGVAMSDDGTFANELTATVQGTSLEVSFTGSGIYSFEAHVDPLWAQEGCTGCHGLASGLTLSGTAAANYTEIYNVVPVCDGGLGGQYRVVSPAGGTAASEDFSILMRFADPGLSTIGGCAGAADAMTMDASAVQILRAWVRNGAPFN